jgi:hypothetical protein
MEGIIGDEDDVGHGYIVSSIRTGEIHVKFWTKSETVCVAYCSFDSLVQKSKEYVTSAISTYSEKHIACCKMHQAILDYQKEVLMEPYRN